MCVSQIFRFVKWSYFQRLPLIFKKMEASFDVIMDNLTKAYTSRKNNQRRGYVEKSVETVEKPLWGMLKTLWKRWKDLRDTEEKTVEWKC